MNRQPEFSGTIDPEKLAGQLNVSDGFSGTGHVDDFFVYDQKLQYESTAASGFLV